MAENLRTFLVTVLMPVYNGGPYLKEAIESILNQTYQDFEFLIIDDGSTDQSVSVISSFSDYRIRLIRNERNSGLIQTLNMGVAMISTPYIARFDADDISDRFRLEKQVLFMEKHSDVGVCGTGFYLLNGENEMNSGQPPTDPEIIKCKLFLNCPLVHPSVLIRKSVLDKIPVVFDEIYKNAEDYDLWSRLKNATEIVNLNEKLITYRVHESQISSSRKWEQRQMANKVRLNLLAELNIIPDSEEIQLHERLCYEEYSELLNQLPETEKWLKKISDANEVYKVYNVIKLQNILLKYWSNAVVYSLKGFKAYSKFYNSQLYDPRFFSFQDRIKYFIKCLVK